MRRISTWTVPSGPCRRIRPVCGRQESRELPGRLVDWANDHGARLMLLAGDLFDSDQLYSQTAQMLAQALSRFRGTVVIAPGNHDWLSAASPYRQPIWPDNVHIFLGRGIERLALPELQCTVYGAAFTAPEEPESGLRGFHAQPDGSARIMVLHGDMGSRESRYRPLTPEEIAATGLDYLALGHVHAPSAMNRAGNTVWAYPGCPQGRGFDELGERGFLFGDVEPGRVDMRFVPFAGRRYESLTVDVSGGDALDAIRRSLPPDTSRDIYRIRLTGETAEPFDAGSPGAGPVGGIFPAGAAGRHAPAPGPVGPLRRRHPAGSVSGAAAPGIRQCRPPAAEGDRAGGALRPGRHGQYH